jgi:N-acetylglucosaminyl-diphospho-decaprenol L-rhamnosyltransferase
MLSQANAGNLRLAIFLVKDRFASYNGSEIKEPGSKPPARRSLYEEVRMKLLVVIVSYRVTDLTIDCLRSLGSEIDKVPGTSVAVCENGTGGDAPERLRRAIDDNGWGSWAELTVVYPNLGFTGGNNLVIGPALKSDDPPEYVLLLNADTIVKERTLEALVTFMDEYPRAGIAGSKFLSARGEIQASPFRFPGIANELDRGLRVGLVSKLLAPWAILHPQSSQPCPVDWVSGACIILRRTMLEQVGLLDEGLYTYFDDADICLRARRMGWETWYVPQSEIIHLEGASTGVGTRLVEARRPAYWFEARHRFFTKHYTRLHAAAVDAAFIGGYVLWRLRRWLQRKPDIDPKHMLADSIRHSVFCRGFRPRVVDNPALRGAPGPPQVTRPPSRRDLQESAACTAANARRASEF